MGVAIDRVSAQPTVAALWLPRNPQHASMYEPARPPKLGSRRWPMHPPKTPQCQGIPAAPRSLCPPRSQARACPLNHRKTSRCQRQVPGSTRQLGKTELAHFRPMLIGLLKTQVFPFLTEQALNQKWHTEHLHDHPSCYRHCCQKRIPSCLAPGQTTTRHR
jgi:hypothetical protein